MNRFLGTALILLFCLITFNLWLISKEGIFTVTADPLLSLSQIVSLESITLISFSLMLITRFHFIENLFGGLDKVYRVHRLIGSIAFVFIINHPLLLAAKSANTPSVSLSYLLPGSNLAYNLGIIPLYLFILAFIFFVFLKIPYHLWRWVHRLLGVGFLLSAIHIFIVGSDVGRFLPLKIWIAFLIILGTFSVFYTVFFYRWFGPKHRYVVDGIERRLDIINIWLKPVKKAIIFDPGQFVYVKFGSKEIGSEPHPYSISSAGFEERLRLSIKIIGDHTLKLPGLKEGDKAEIFGPYGSFGKQYKIEGKDQLWIAGGIGITPFLSMLRHEYLAQSEKKITLFYSFRNPEEGVFSYEIDYLTKNLGNVTFINWCSKERGRLDGKKAVGAITNLLNIKISLCGPTAMMESLKKQFLEMGVSEDNIHHERFEMV